MAQVVQLDRKVRRRQQELCVVTMKAVFTSLLIAMGFAQTGCASLQSELQHMLNQLDRSSGAGLQLGWKSADESFVLAKLSDVDPQKITCSELLSLAKGLTHAEYIERIEFVGPNRIEQV